MDLNLCSKEDLESPSANGVSKLFLYWDPTVNQNGVGSRSYLFSLNIHRRSPEEVC